MNTNNWISVKKELPKAETRVLILFERKIYNGEIYQDVLCGFHEDGTVWREDSKTTWDIDMCMEYDEKKDDYRIPKGWYEELVNRIDEYNVVAIDDRVTHWMPLPNPPTETGGRMMRNKEELFFLIDRAIESARCRIYRVKANIGESYAHQIKAENQNELMGITIKALKFYKGKLEQEGE